MSGTARSFDADEWLMAGRSNSRGYVWQSTPEERARSFPCDRHLPPPHEALFRAISISAAPARVFDWLCQLRVAPYSYDWIDNFGKKSPRTLDPKLRELREGQIFMQIFRLVEFRADEHITLVTTPAGARLFGRIFVTYQVLPTGAVESRLVVKLLTGPARNLLGRMLWPLLAWGDWIMMRKQLLTLKELAEKSSRG